MELKENIENKNLNEWLSGIKPLPEYVKLYKLNHHSPSQANTADDMWGYKYLYLTQEERRNLPTNTNMKCGNWIGYLGQKQFGKYIWEYEKGSGLVKKQIPLEKKIFDKAVDQFNAYLPKDDKDKMQHANNKLAFAIVWKNLKDGFAKIGLKGDLECERSVSLNLDGCQLPMIGRVDFENKTSFVELKTKWRKGNKPKQDGTRSYSITKCATPEDPKIEKYRGWFDHLAQVAFYAEATKKKPYLLVVNEGGYIIYSPDNCIQLKPKNLKTFIKKYSQICSKREKIMEKHQGKTTWVEEIVPNFDHYFWRDMGEHKLKAMRMWGFA